MSLQFNDPNHVHAVSGTSTGEALTYDKAGNIAARAGGETYTFDAENRMTKTTSYPTSTDYKYDGQGNLAVRSTTATARAAAVDDRTVYVGGVYEERTEYGIGINAEATVMYQAFGRTIATRTGTKTTYLLADHLGSTVGSVSADGSEVHQVRYWPYGKVRSGGVGTDKMYTGQQMEANSPLGAYFYKARFYSTTLGHFLSADSLFEHANQSSSGNRYTYVSNNPMSRIDPTGHADCSGLFGCLTAEQLEVAWVAGSCGSGFAQCLFDAAGGDSAKYIRLTAALFGISATVLSAVLLNEIYHLNAGDEPMLEALWGLASLLSDSLAEQAASHTYGIAQLSPETIMTRINKVFALPEAGSVHDYISRLQDPLWGVVYAAAWLGVLHLALGGRGNDYSLLVAYHGGDFEDWVFKGAGAPQCGQSGVCNAQTEASWPKCSPIIGTRTLISLPP